MFMVIGVHSRFGLSTLLYYVFFKSRVDFKSCVKQKSKCLKSNPKLTSILGTRNQNNIFTVNQIVIFIIFFKICVFVNILLQLNNIV